jgi:hypothetical protein
MTTQNFGPDQRTRVMLFAENLDLLQGEDLSVVTAQAVDAQNTLYPLAVEYVGKVPDFNWLSSVIVRLPDTQSFTETCQSVSAYAVQTVTELCYRLKLPEKTLTSPFATLPHLRVSNAAASLHYFSKAPTVQRCRPGLRYFSQRLALG